MSDFILKNTKNFTKSMVISLPYSIRISVRRLKILRPVLPPTVVAQVVVQPF